MADPNPYLLTGGLGDFEDDSLGSLSGSATTPGAGVVTDDGGQDYRAWDFTESCVYRGPRLGRLTAPAVGVGVARKRALTRRELAASAGAYTGQDRVWLLPAAELPHGFQARPGGTVTDGDGVRWTALEVQLNRHGQTWRLTSRNLALAYDLSHKIDVQRAAVSLDDAGGTVRVWPPRGGSIPYEQLAARVQPQTQQTGDERGVRDTETDYLVYIDAQVELAGQERVRWVDDDGVEVILDIVALRNPRRIDELPYLECKRKV